MLKDAGVKVDLAPEAALPDGEAYVEAGLGHADVAAMFYASGTTGHPKGRADHARGVPHQHPVHGSLPSVPEG